MRTTMLRRQHDVAVDLVRQIVELSSVDPIDSLKAYQIGLVLAKLTGMLRIHFAQEDKSLYPLLAASRHGPTAKMAVRFQGEIGGLAPIYEAFAARWSASQAILNDVGGFRSESQAVFAALADRIQRENDELYPLADALPQEFAATAA